ncbi:MAG: hypothetical protein CMF28_04125 [Kiritimatiellaceae bacterium]|nr:hypothetical protein [Kiritimatiellaceae bacterium]RZO88280.1 MAG: hypothetical protein EVA58_00595 [Kiritimatiellaceae bacterium]
MAINQAVIFTKPIYHLSHALTPDALYEQVESFLTERRFYVRTHRCVTGVELAAGGIMDQHYVVYSKAVRVAALEDLQVSDEAKERFGNRFETTWHDEVAQGRLMSTDQLMKQRSLSATSVLDEWEKNLAAGKAFKVQAGLIVTFVEAFNSFVINGFYPAMAERFNHADNVMHYLVVEFDSNDCSWRSFRQDVLGVTNAAKASASSLRGQLFAEYPVELPGSDNFVHGSAGPLEGFAERLVHEEEVGLATSPIGVYLQRRGVSAVTFRAWCARQPIVELASLFDLTEEKNSNEILSILDPIDFR